LLQLSDHRQQSSPPPLHVDGLGSPATDPQKTNVVRRKKVTGTFFLAAWAGRSLRGSRQFVSAPANELSGRFDQNRSVGRYVVLSAAQRDCRTIGCQGSPTVQPLH